MQVWSDEWSRARESAADWRMVAEGSLEPGNSEKAKKSQSERCKAEERMGVDSSGDILRIGEACTLQLRAAVIESSGDSRQQRGIC
jgi:hypothetical protein